MKYKIVLKYDGLIYTSVVSDGSLTMEEAAKQTYKNINGFDKLQMELVNGAIAIFPKHVVESSVLIIAPVEDSE